MTKERTKQALKAIELLKSYKLIKYGSVDEIRLKDSKFSQDVEALLSEIEQSEKK